MHGLVSDRAVLGRALELDAKVVALTFQLADLFGHSRAGRSGVVHRVPQRRGGVHGREHLASRGFHIRLESFDGPLNIRVRGFLAPQRLRGLLPIGGRPRGGFTARFELDPRRLPPRVERAHFGLDVGGRRGERLHLLLVERDLLVQPPDLELACMGGFARGRGPAVRFRQFQAQPFERRFDFGDMRRRHAPSRSRAPASFVRVESMASPRTR